MIVFGNEDNNTIQEALFRPSASRTGFEEASPFLNEENTVQQAFFPSSSSASHTQPPRKRLRSKEAPKKRQKKKADISGLEDINEGIQSTRKAEELLQSLRGYNRDTENHAETIARRTRATHPMRDVDFDDIDMIAYDNLRDSDDSQDTVDAATVRSVNSDRPQKDPCFYGCFTWYRKTIKNLFVGLEIKRLAKVREKFMNSSLTLVITCEY